MSAPDRFARQRRFVGERGQERVEGARVLLVGAGALGGVLAQTLVRAGVGELVIVDRDVVEPTNLARQVLFEERHVGQAKASAAAETLAAIGGPTRVTAICDHVDADNAVELSDGAALLLDGTDNLATRYLLNDLAVRSGRPWVYGGVVGGSGRALGVLPGRGPCLRCVFPDPPPPGALGTCETDGVILPAVAVVAGWQAAFALRWLAASEEERERLQPALVELDPWNGVARRLRVARDPACPCCGERDFPFLESPPQRTAVSLCGRNTVQIRPARPAGLARARGPAAADLRRVTERLGDAARRVRSMGSFVRFEAEGLTLSVFADGRALVEGTDDVDRARAAYDRYVGA